MAAALFGIAWFAPSHDYLYVPNTATPVASKVTVEGEKPHLPGPGAIYYVDVSIRRATWAERVLPFVRPDGASLVPRAEVVPPARRSRPGTRTGCARWPGRRRSQRRSRSSRPGSRSTATNRGALVEAVASDAPAATKLDPGDVIVAARGRPITHPGRAAQRRSPASTPATTSSFACGETARSRR